MQTQFFNTTSLSGCALVEATVRAYKQDDIILSIFQEYPSIRFTPFDIQSNVKRIYGKDYPITSVRRGINTLTSEGFLTKSEKAEGKGIYKMPNHRWQLNTSAIC